MRCSESMCSGPYGPWHSLDMFRAPRQGGAYALCVLLGAEGLERSLSQQCFAEYLNFLTQKILTMEIKGCL